LTHIRPYIFALCTFLAIQSVAFAGGIEKGFEALEVKDFYGAKKQFEKLLSKNPIASRFGLSRVHFERNNPFYDIDLAMDYCQNADSLYAFVTPRQQVRLERLNISRTAILEFKQSIAQRAYEELRIDFSEEALNKYLKKYRSSTSFALAVSIRDSIAFEKAQIVDTYDAYRDFIIEYPGARQRLSADSLYALRFFEERTTAGNVDDYKLFVREFPANPYVGKAYDTIFSYVESSGTLQAYESYLKEFPENKNSKRAWKAFNLTMLRDYKESTLEKLIEQFPKNPYKNLLTRELESLRTNYFVLKVDGGVQLIDLNGNSLGTVKDAIGEYHEGLAKVVENGQVGYINGSGDMVVQPIYSDGFDFSFGLAVVEKEGYFGALNRFGDIVIPCVYDELGNMQDGMIAFEKNGESGFLGWNGDPVLDADYDYVADFNQGHAVVRLEGLYGAIDTQGRYTVPCQFDWVEEYELGVSRVRQGELYGLYAHGQGLILPIEYEAIGENRDGRRLISKDGLYGFVNSHVEVVIPLEYEFDERLVEQLSFNGEYAIIKRKNLWGIIDRSGAVLVVPKYDELVNSGYTIFPFRRRNKWGHVDSEGREFKTLYDEVGPFSQGLALVENSGKVGLVDMNGKVVVPIAYQKLEVIEDTEYLIFTSENGDGLMTRNGEEILAPSYDDINAANIRYLRLTTGGIDDLYDLTENKIVWSSKM
jgi:hypothetical protein